MSRPSRGALLPRSPLLPLALATLALLLAGCGSSSSTSSAPSGVPGGATTAGGPAKAPSKPISPKSVEETILHFGSPATGAQKAAVESAAHSFFTALANRDYAKVCAGMIGAGRAGAAVLSKGAGKKAKGGGCPTFMKMLLKASGATDGAAQAAKGTTSGVRVLGNTAYLIYKPAAGPLSYFVMKREKGGWRANGLAGTPVKEQG